MESRFIVRVKIFGPLKEVSRKDLFEIETYENESLMDALRRLPKPLQEMIFENERLSSNLLVLIDGIEVSCLGKPNKINLKGVKEIHLVPVIHGG